MGLKLKGFVCDNCSRFHQHEGVKSGVELLDKMEQGLIDLTSINMSFAKIDEWLFCDVIELDGDWISWTSSSKCFCPNCRRLVKLKKIINLYERI